MTEPTYVKVALDSPVPLLDKPFDYVVPDSLLETALVGTRVQVNFGGRRMFGWILERSASTDFTGSLQPLIRVVSEQQILTPRLFRLLRAVADRYAGILSDVIRAAIPPRVAGVDKEFAAEQLAASEPPEPTSHSLDSGESGTFPRVAQRQVHTLLNSTGDTRARFDLLIQEALERLQRGEGAILVVPDSRDLAVLQERLADRLAQWPQESAPSVLTLASEDGKTARYRAYLKVLHGQSQLVIGTRSALFAPVENLGFIGVYDDADPSYLEQHAPYFHAREVALLRSQLENVDLLFLAPARSPELQRLVDKGWLHQASTPRESTRAHTPAVISTADEYEQERDPTAQFARLPQRAWENIQEGLTRGPVLVQVARKGYAPALACERCRTPLRCPVCETSMILRAQDATPECPACTFVEENFECQVCENRTFRLATVGSARTAQELARSFPSTKILESAGEHIIDAIPDEPAIVIATPGAEPECSAGYSSTVLLDGDRSLTRGSLSAESAVVRHWFNAAVRTRPRAQGGSVVVVSRHLSPANFLVRWAPEQHAEKELEERVELGMPPIRRFAVVEGEEASVRHFLSGLHVPEGVQRFEEVVEGSTAFAFRSILMTPLRQASALSAALAERRRELSPKSGSPDSRLRVRIDPPDTL